MPKISVIIAVYNAERYLRTCLKSVLNQTIKDIEVICVNDGSTDKSIEILKDYASEDSRIKVFSQENRGAGAVKDYGLYLASGDYVTFCDSDDELPLDSLSLRYARAVAENADVTVGNYELIYDDNRRQSANIKKEGDSPFWWIFSSIILPNKLFSRKFIFDNDLHIPDIKQSEDRIFMTDLFLCNPKVVALDNIVYYWMRREHTGQKSLSYRFLEQDYFDRIGSWYYSIDKLLSNGHQEANRRLIISANYLKSLYKDFPETEKKKEAFEAIRQLMCRADWSRDYELFCNIWGVPYDVFAVATYDNFRTHVQGEKIGFRDAQPRAVCLAPKVSVIIPCYNSVKYLRECMDSILNQTLNEIEVICIDDGSTDKTPDILEEYAHADHRVTVLYQENKFAGTARNLGMTRAKGEYLIFLDSDDFFDLNMLKLVYSKVKEDCGDILVFSAYCYSDNSGKLTDAPWLLNTSYLPKHRPFSRKDIPQHIFSFASTAPWNKLFKRDYIEKIGLQFQATQRMNDIYFVMTAIALAERITTLDRKLLFYRVNVPDSLQGTTSKTPTDVYYALMEVQKVLMNHSIYDELEQSFVNLCLRNLVYVLDTMKTGKSFEELYDLIKYQYFNDLRISGRSAEYFFRDYYYLRYRELSDKTAAEFLFDKLSRAKQEHRNKTAEAAVLIQKADASAADEQLVHSRSYKIGRAITWLPRKLRGFVRCLKKNGWSYTVRRVLEHFGIPMDKSGLSYGFNKRPRSPRIIVSLTSYPARINIVHKTIVTLLNQTVKPDLLILWLAKEQFPGRKKALPKELKRLKKYGLTIRWCDDLRPHKKYFYTMQNYPGDIVITVDDDIYYDSDLVETLYSSYQRFPNAISAGRVHKIGFLPDGGLAPYKTWKQQDDSFLFNPSMDAIATGAGGILYPPYCLDEKVFDKNIIRQYCINTDDLWLKIMEVMKGTPTVLARTHTKLKYIEDSQKSGLWHYNITKGNDVCLKSLFDIYDNYYGKDDTLLSRIRSRNGGNIHTGKTQETTVLLSSAG